jgi:P-type Ca2+ transporter type 2C
VQGMSTSGAAARLKAEGFNELPRAGHRPIARLILDVLREPMLLLLLAGGAIYLHLAT